jgi:hypothetical protein
VFAFHRPGGRPSERTGVSTISFIGDRWDDLSGQQIFWARSARSELEQGIAQFAGVSVGLAPGIGPSMVVGVTEPALSVFGASAAGEPVSGAARLGTDMSVSGDASVTGFRTKLK